MSVSPVFSNVSLARVAQTTVATPATPTPGALTQTLQRFLSMTLERRLSWRHSRRREQADAVEETFVAEDDAARVELRASRRQGEAKSGASGDARTESPRRLLRWQVIVRLPGQKDRMLDGRDLALPAVAPDRAANPAEQTIARLFRAAFETLARGFDALVSPLQALARDLRAGRIQSCYSFIRPSLANPLGAAEILQVSGEGDGGPIGLELARFLGQRQLTLRLGGRVVKLGEPALENAAIRQAVGEIEALADAQRKGRLPRP